MDLTEEQIEDLVYKNPWLIDERYIIPSIKGTKGDGRQVNVGIKNSRFIDLLFLDIKDNRPVIIEIKKGHIKREDIAQILEYRAWINMLNDADSKKWEEVFGKNYFAPKMILLGENAEDAAILSANLANVELRTFTDKEIANGFNTIENFEFKLKEWNEFKNSGNRTLIDRFEWVENIIDSINNTLSSFNNIKLVNKNYVEKSYNKKIYPFIDFPIEHKEKSIELLGLYEFSDEHTPFNEEYIYCDLPFLFSLEDNDELDVNDYKSIKQKIKKDWSDTHIYNDYEVPILKIPRTELGDIKKIKKCIQRLVALSSELFEAYKVKVYKL